MVLQILVVTAIGLGRVSNLQVERSGSWEAIDSVVAEPGVRDELVVVAENLDEIGPIARKISVDISAPIIGIAFGEAERLDPFDERSIVSVGIRVWLGEGVEGREVGPGEADC